MGKHFLYNILLFVILTLIDQVSKKYAVYLSTYHLNFGIMLGLLKDSSFFFRLTTLASFFGFIFSIYTLLIYLMRTNLRLLKVGLTFLVAGIFGNVIDKIQLSASVDFIPFDIFNLVIRFNIADIFQWIGVGIILYKVLTKDHLIWYPDDKRGQWLIFKKEQIRFAFKMTIAVFCSSIIFGIFCFSFVRAVLLENNIKQNVYFAHFSISYFFFSLIFGLVVFVAGVILSHKTAGPIYSFMRYIDQLLSHDEGEVIEFKLREGDNYKSLEKTAQKIKSRLVK